MKIGLDIGGTKCAISTGESADGKIKILSREEFPTAGLSWHQVLEEFARRIEVLTSTSPVPHSPFPVPLSSIGISCGGPLDSKRGVIMSPPNLPGWDDVPVVKFFEDRFHVPTAVQNDANACALAEYLYGSGRGVKNLVFMTFGTGLGAGIIIDGKLYSGSNDNAGEIGHIRLAPAGPVGYNKEGSAEGFCSGAGMARLAKIRKGLDLTAKELFARVRAGDPDCTEVFRESAEKLATLRSPLTLDDGYTIRPVPVEVVRDFGDNTRLLRFVLGEGRKRQIRKMCSAAHLVVLTLKRVAVGRFELPPDLAPGEWRDLTPDEIGRLRG